MELDIIKISYSQKKKFCGFLSWAENRIYIYKYILLYIYVYVYTYINIKVEELAQGRREAMGDRTKEGKKQWSMFENITMTPIIFHENENKWAN